METILEVLFCQVVIDFIGLGDLLVTRKVDYRLWLVKEYIGWNLSTLWREFWFIKSLNGSLLD